MEITILGSGTSGGIPEPCCRCPVCLSADPRNNRFRASVFVRSGGHQVLIDTATEFRLQMIREGIDRLDAILVTHPHADHISGMDDLRNFTFEYPVPVYGSNETLEGIRERFGYFFRKTQRGGGKPKVKLHEVSAPFDAGGLSWIPLPVLHGLLPVLGYRTGRFAYVTDASSIPPQTEELLSGLEVLVLGALRYRPHETHMNIEQAVRFAERIGPKRTYLTHFCHDIEHEKLERELPSGIFPSYDGLKITLTE